MKISTWSLGGFSFGIVFSLFSAIRYFVLYPDEDKAIAYVIIGLLIISISWLYNRMLKLNNQLTAVEDFLADRK